MLDLSVRKFFLHYWSAALLVSS